MIAIAQTSAVTAITRAGAEERLLMTNYTLFARCAKGQEWMLARSALIVNPDRQGIV
jgi:hypothetical protein